MKKVVLIGLLLVLIAPLLLLILGIGNANIEAARAACATATNTSTGGSFGLGSLNWRGASHHKKNPHRGERPYSARMPNMINKIEASGASIIGFQEFEPRQATAFLRSTGGAWAIVRGKRGRSKPSTANAIAYRSSEWKVDEVRHVSIRYGRTTVQIPMARFTSTSGLGSVWLLNTHNPARAVGGSGAMRDRAVRAEAKALQAAAAAEPTTPLFLTGDMNDKARFKRLFLSLAPGWSAANPNDKYIDWIMGSPDVTFSGTVIDQSTNDKARRYTDHPFVHTRVHLAATPGAAESNTAGLGVMPTDIAAIPGRAVAGQVLVANATIKLRSGAMPGIRALADRSPDFITLNEVEDVPLAQMRSAAPGYDAYRDQRPATGDPARQSMGSAIMWRSETWSRLDGGRVKIVDNDHVVFGGKNKLWDRYAIWGVFQRSDGAVVSVIATHHMTNVYRFPRQWGEPSMTRAEQYGLGMDHLTHLVDTLALYGSVLVGGDMNSHPRDGPNAAAPRMTAAGYRYTKGSGVMYNFYPAAGRVTKTWQIGKAAVHSDHPALFTRLDLNGAGLDTAGAAGISAGQASPADCPPCPTSTTTGTVLTPDGSAPGNTKGVELTASAAYEAGFRGEDLVTAVAIAGVESTWNPQAVNGTHYGLWQISQQHQGKVASWNAYADIYDPVTNAKYAYALYSARPGSGEAKFADWIPFEKTDHHQFLDTARQAVAATAGGGDLTANGCEGASTTQVAGQLPAAVKARLDAMTTTTHGLCALSWTSDAPCTYNNQCPKVVDALYGGRGVGRGYGDGQYVAGGLVRAGLAQSHGTGLDPLPPVGAVVSYNSGNGVGHVALYVGGGKIFGNDYGCSANGVYGCVGFADVRDPSGSVTWALPKKSFDLGGMPAASA